MGVGQTGFQFYHCTNLCNFGDIPGGPVVKTALPIQGAQVWCLVGRLDPACMLQLSLYPTTKVCTPQLNTPYTTTKSQCSKNKVNIFNTHQMCPTLKKLSATPESQILICKTGWLLKLNEIIYTRLLTHSFGKVCGLSRSVVSDSWDPMYCTPWTVARQAPYPWDFPGKTTAVGCYFLLQGIFLTRASNPTQVFCIAGRLLTDWATREAQMPSYARVYNKGMEKTQMALGFNLAKETYISTVFGTD